MAINFLTAGILSLCQISLVYILILIGLGILIGLAIIIIAQIKYSHKIM